MQIVIEIEGETYEFIKKFWGAFVGRGSGKKLQYDVINAVKNGVPLPEHHGRLIDADKLIRDTIKNPVHAPYIHIIDMKEALTIIEESDSE